ncbi:MAG: hypothetical protein PVI03_02095 [Candidatus Thorarchaeota archaeon]|jgi:hypothetical protein
MSATQEGVESSIHDRLMSVLEPEMEQEIDTSEESVEPEAGEEVEELEAVEAEGDEESVEAEPSEIEAQEQEPSEPAQEIELVHIAEYLGASEDQFTVSDDGELMVKTKIDGEEGQAKFSDLLKSYQLEGHLNKQSTELAETKKALQSKLADADGEIAQKVQQLETLSQLAYNELLSEYNAIDWAELEQDQPDIYAAKMIKFQNRQNEIANLYQKAQDQRSELAATGKVTPEKIAEEKSKLLAAIPEWADEATFNKEWTSVGEYAISNGFSSEEYQGTTDHRLLVLLNKARQFDALNQKSPQVTNRVRKAPKIAKPGSTASKISNKQMEAQKRMAKIKRDGGGNALHEELLSRLG